MPRKDYTVKRGYLYHLLNSQYSRFYGAEERFPEFLDRSQWPFDLGTSPDVNQSYNDDINLTDVIDYFKKVAAASQAYYGTANEAGVITKQVCNEVLDKLTKIEASLDLDARVQRDINRGPKVQPQTKTQSRDLNRGLNVQPQTRTQSRDLNRGLNAQTQTKAQRRGFELQKYANMFATSKAEVDLIIKINGAMNQLSELTSKLSTPDENGKLPELTAENLTKLRELYGQVIEIATPYLKSLNGKYNAFAKNISKINEIVSKDLIALETVSPAPGLTLAAAIKNSRSTVIDIGTQQTVTKGQALSERMPIVATAADGTKRKGMFTKNSNFNPDQTILAGLEKLCERRPDFRPYYEKIKTAVDGGESLISVFKDDNIIFAPGKMSISEKNDLTDIFAEIRKLDNAGDLFTELYTISQKGLAQVWTYDEDLKLKNGVNIDKRNSAMSFVADMIGCPNLIARSQPMTVIQDGQRIDGTFMEFAHGTDMNNLNLDDPFLKSTPADFEKCPGLKDVANLTVLDYICGNVDRHVGNMFLQFGGPSGHQLVGVVGIDNDASFGDIDDAYIHSKLPQRLATAESLKYIGVDAAKHIMSLSPDTLRVGLQSYGLSEAEITAATVRLQNVQEKITSGKITICKDEDWQKITIDDYPTRGAFNEVWVIRDKQMDRLSHLKPNSSEPPVFPEGSGVEKPEDYDKIIDKLDKHAAELQEANKGAFIGSKQYDNVMAYMKYARQEFAAMAANYDPGNPEQKGQYYERTQELLGNLSDFATIYLDRKMNDNSADHNERSRNRSMAVLGLRDFCDNNVNKYMCPDDKAYRLLSVEERKQAYKQMNAKEMGKQIVRVTKIQAMDPQAKQELDATIKRELSTIKTTKPSGPSL